MKKFKRASYLCESWKYIDKFYAKGIPAIAFSEIWLDLMLNAHLSIPDNLKRKSRRFGRSKIWCESWKNGKPLRRKGMADREKARARFERGLDANDARCGKSNRWAAARDLFRCGGAK
jgi:hypothetical protein